MRDQVERSDDWRVEGFRGSEVVRRHLVLDTAKLADLFFESRDLGAQLRDLFDEILTRLFLAHATTLAQSTG